MDYFGQGLCLSGKDFDQGARISSKGQGFCLVEKNFVQGERIPLIAREGFDWGKFESRSLYRVQNCSFLFFSLP